MNSPPPTPDEIRRAGPDLPRPPLDWPNIPVPPRWDFPRENLGRRRRVRDGWVPVLEPYYRG